MKIKKILTSILAITLILIIFIFSGQNGGKSISVSDNFTGRFIDKVASVINKEVSAKRKKELIYQTRFIVRKTAHFTLYFTLGILIYLLLSFYKFNHRIFMSILICFTLACCDEYHQLFVVGRTARFYDCIVDTLGSTTSIVILNLFEKIRKNINKKRLSI